MFKKKKVANNIKWIPASLNAWQKVRMPQSSKAYVPEWYKKIPLWENGEKRVDTFADGSWESNATLRKCVPFMDTFLAGYIQELWCDIVFYKNDDGTLGWDHNAKEDPISQRPSSHLPNSDNWHNIEFVWKTQWEPQTPEGYSSLYVHPLNRIDLPFYTLSGIIDTDNWPIAGNYPFLLNKNFLGTIKRGTPIYQIIPIKRETWTSQEVEFSQDVEDLINKKLSTVKSHIVDGYRNEFWEKKKYE
jgi:hypothetical protein